MKRDNRPQDKIKTFKGYYKAAPFLTISDLLEAAGIKTPVEIRRACEEDHEFSEMLGLFRYRRVE